MFPGDKFIPKMYLRHPGFTYGVLGPFTKSKERFKDLRKFKEMGNFGGLWRFKDLPRRATSDEILCDNSFNIAKNLNYDINVDLL